MQGDERKLKDGVVFLTVHDVGATYQVLDLVAAFDSFFFDIICQNWVTFLKDESMADIRAR